VGLLKNCSVEGMWQGIGLLEISGLIEKLYCGGNVERYRLVGN
jgi:hypothetical protein